MQMVWAISMTTEQTRYAHIEWSHREMWLKALEKVSVTVVITSNDLCRFQTHWQTFLNPPVNDLQKQNIYIY